MGYPSLALGGEAKVLYPDGTTILLGQRERSASQPPLAEEEAPPHFSLLKEAAAVVAASGGALPLPPGVHLETSRAQPKAPREIFDATGNLALVVLHPAHGITVPVPVP